jgi:hypothetical protein
MTPDDSIHYFEAQAVGHARTLPMHEARRFLLGMLAVTSGQELEGTRRAFTNLCIADDQLELIAGGQLRLNLGGRE